MLFQPSNISPSEINGSGTVDLSQNLVITWQVNGDSAMTKYQIDIYTNNVASTLKYSTGVITLATPFWGVNYKGETQYYSVTISASDLASSSIVNGSEYKFTIKQWWDTNSYIEQSTASLMLGRSTPTVSINTITPNPLTSYEYQFTGTYSQAQGDTLKWVRWQIAVKDSQGNRQSPFYDTGRITGTGQLRVDYSGFLNNTSYSIKLDVESSNGVEATSGWVDFSVQYATSAATGEVTAAQQNDGSVLVSWPQVQSAQGYDIFRLESGATILEKIASVNNATGQIRDYSACSGTTYTWYVCANGPYAYLTDPMVSNEVSVCFWFWILTEAQKNSDGTYAAVSNYIFRYGSGGVKEGSFSNNNSPNIQKNFTRYPTRQPDSANYLTGSISGLIGDISSSKMYSDTLEQARALRELSTSENVIFLRDPKGHFICVQTSQPITLSINHGPKEMPQTLTVTWVEIEDTDGVKITSTPQSTFWPVDNILFTKVWVEPTTGQLIWETVDDYAYGSTLTISDGNLYQNTTDGYTVATMQITNNNQLVGEISGS